MPDMSSALLPISAAEVRVDIRSWLASGDLQTPDGAYAAWRDAGSGELAFAYPEITGYALTWLAGRPGLTDAELSAGRRAGEWLVARLAESRAARDGWDLGAVYNFDLGMISAGLISFGRLTLLSKITDFGVLLARDLAAEVLSAGGLAPVSPAGPPTGRSAQWSTTGRPHLIKCVQALLLSEELEAAGALAGTAKDLQKQEGWCLTQPDPSHVMLHPHLYAIEGLWMWGTAASDELALSRARHATEWVWRHQLPSGGFPRLVSFDNKMPAPEQWDVTSQAIRSAVMVGVEPPGLDRAVERIIQLSRPAGSGRGLVYQPSGGEEHLNSWVSMFGAQALELFADGPEAMRWDQLV